MDEYLIWYRVYSRSENREIEFTKGQKYSSKEEAEEFVKINFKATNVRNLGLWFFDTNCIYKIEDEDHYADYIWAIALIRHI